MRDADSGGYAIHVAVWQARQPFIFKHRTLGLCLAWVRDADSGGYAIHVAVWQARPRADGTFLAPNPWSVAGLGVRRRQRRLRHPRRRVAGAAPRRRHIFSTEPLVCGWPGCATATAAATPSTSPCGRRGPAPTAVYFNRQTLGLWPAWVRDADSGGYAIHVAVWQARPCTAWTSQACIALL